MQSVIEIERIGVNAVKRLRQTRLSSGLFFMINSNTLPPDHCYLEFPNGVIKLAIHEPRARDFIIVRELEDDECKDLRKKFDFQ